MLHVYSLLFVNQNETHDKCYSNEESPLFKNIVYIVLSISMELHQSSDMYQTDCTGGGGGIRQDRVISFYVRGLAVYFI